MSSSKSNMTYKAPMPTISQSFGEVMNPATASINNFLKFLFHTLEHFRVLLRYIFLFLNILGEIKQGKLWRRLIS